MLVHHLSKNNKEWTTIISILMELKQFQWRKLAIMKMAKELTNSVLKSQGRILMNWRKAQSIVNSCYLPLPKIKIIATMEGLVQQAETHSQAVFQEEIRAKVEVQIQTLEEIWTYQLKSNSL